MIKNNVLYFRIINYIEVARIIDTNIYINKLDKNGLDFSAYISLWSHSITSVKGYLTINENNNSNSIFAVFAVTGNVINNITYFTVPVTYISGNSIPGNNDNLSISFASSGQDGNQGRQGATGPQGLQGTQGLQGPTGIQGVTGPQGFQGPMSADLVVGTFSSIGTTSSMIFTFSHYLGYTPSATSITPMNANAAGLFYVTYTNLVITLHYISAPSGLLLWNYLLK